MTIIYASEPNLSIDDFRVLLKQSAFDSSYPLSDTTHLAAILKNSDIVITARSDGQLIGLARAITDYSHACYLCDLMVLPNYRRQGIGKTLIEETHKVAGPQTGLVTLAGPEAGSFYPRIGMESRPNAWIRKRTE